MRITVTVVVIMFELTGALTYILPTMVNMEVILSKHVSEYLTYADCAIGNEGCRGLPRNPRDCRRDDPFQRFPFLGQGGTCLQCRRYVEFLWPVIETSFCISVERHEEGTTHLECIWHDRSGSRWVSVLYSPWICRCNDAYEESMLGNTNVNGFPIIASGNNRIIMGYIGSTELRYVLGRFHHLDNRFCRPDWIHR